MSTLYENKTNNETNALPVNAKIKVFVIVPIISLPISIPESKIVFESSLADDEIILIRQKQLTFQHP